MIRTRAHTLKKLAKRRAALNHGVVLSFRAPEFPTAVMVPRRPVARARWELWRWTVAKWAWIKPRTVPLIVAAILWKVIPTFAGMTSGR